MGKREVSGCLRCGGILFIDRDIDGWYEQSINCSYRNELKVWGDLAKKLVTKEKTTSMKPSSGQFYCENFSTVTKVAYSW